MGRMRRPSKRRSALGSTKTKNRDGEKKLDWLKNKDCGISESFVVVLNASARHSVVKSSSFQCVCKLLRTCDSRQTTMIGKKFVKALKSRQQFTKSSDASRDLSLVGHHVVESSGSTERSCPSTLHTMTRDSPCIKCLW